MKTTAITQNPQPKKHQLKKAAGTGAIVAFGLYTVATGLSYATNKDVFQQAIEHAGGTRNYVACVALAAGIVSAAGAAVNTAFTFISNMIKPKEPPKAAN